jgi:hypothetical protein
MWSRGRFVSRLCCRLTGGLLPERCFDTHLLAIDPRTTRSVWVWPALQVREIGLGSAAFFDIFRASIVTMSWMIRRS